MELSRWTHWVGALAVGLLPGCVEGGGTVTTTATTATTATTSGSTSATADAGTSTTGTSTTGAGTSTSTTGEASTSTTEGCSFLGCDDMPPSSLECSTWEQDCPSGEKCTIYANDGGGSWNASRCVPLVPDPDGIGQSCEALKSGVSGLDTCREGALCWGVDPVTLEGTCYAFCEGSYEDPSCPPASWCATAAEVVAICLPWCHPLEEDCLAGDVCVPNENIDGFGCDDDVSGATGAYGDPCTDANTCDPGLYCAAAAHVPGCDAERCCTPFCDYLKDNTCPGDGQECLHWYGAIEAGDAPLGFFNLGVCGIAG